MLNRDWDTQKARHDYEESIKGRKCFYCGEQATELVKNVQVEEGAYGDVWMCDRHAEDYYEGDGDFAPEY